MPKLTIKEKSGVRESGPLAAAGGTCPPTTECRLPTSDYFKRIVALIDTPARVLWPTRVPRAQSGVTVLMAIIKETFMTGVRNLLLLTQKSFTSGQNVTVFAGCDYKPGAVIGRYL